MKKFMAGFSIMVLAVMAFAWAGLCRAEEKAPAQKQAVSPLPDCDWPCLQEKVKNETMPLDIALGMAKSFEAAVKEAQDLAKSGNYDKASKATPITWCAAWYALNHLRSLMGGTRSADGYWSGFTCEYKVYKPSPGEKNVVTKYSGTNKKECVDQTDVVRQLIEAAGTSRLKPTKDGESMARCAEYLAKFETLLGDGLVEPMAVEK
jgi:hypothetical protein